MSYSKSEKDDIKRHKLGCEEIEEERAVLIYYLMVLLSFPQGEYNANGTY
jgi:hypothetical protein